MRPDTSARDRLYMSSRKLFVSLTLALFLLASAFPHARVVSAQTSASQAASVAIVIDTSSSVYDKKLSKLTREALERFVRQGATGSEYFVVGVNTSTEFYSADSTGADDAVKAINKLLSSKKEGATALYDACVLSATRVFNTKSDRRFVVVLSDGVDTISQVTLEDAQKVLKTTGVKLFAVVLDRGRIENELYEIGARNLESLASATGGAAYRLGKESAPDAALEKIAAAMNR